MGARGGLEHVGRQVGQDLKVSGGELLPFQSGQEAKLGCGVLSVERGVLGDGDGMLVLLAVPNAWALGPGLLCIWDILGPEPRCRLRPSLPAGRHPSCSPDVGEGQLVQSGSWAKRGEKLEVPFFS